MERLKGRSPPKGKQLKKLTPRLSKTMPIVQIIQIINPHFLKQKIMKTINLNSKTGNNGTNSTGTPAQSPAIKAGALEPSKSFESASEKADVKKINIPPVNVQGAEPVKEEAKKDEVTQESKVQQVPVQAEKPALNLEGTLKLVEELHRRKIHRDNLLNTINTLEEFEVLIADESQELDSVKFQACKLTIEDDDRNTFTTKNPVIIKAVADFVNSLCVNKLAEIEANIVIPA